MPVYNERGELFESILVRIINNKIKNGFEFDFSDKNNIKLLNDR